MHFLKKIISCLLSFTFLLAVFPVISSADVTQEKVISVNGVEMTLDDFLTVAKTDTFQGEEVVLLNDIEDASSWQTVTSFQGSFDGNGKTISQLGVPLFQELSGTAQVFDLTLEGQIGSFDNRCVLSTAMGALACTLPSGTVSITNVTNRVDLIVKHVSYGVGGIVGEQTGGALSISQCKNEGRVDCVNLWTTKTATVFAGGIPMDHKRIVIKVGTSTLTHESGNLDLRHIEQFL